MMGFVASGYRHAHRVELHQSKCELTRRSQEVVLRCSANDFRERFEGQLRSLQDEVCSEVVSWLKISTESAANGLLTGIVGRVLDATGETRWWR
mmetsp:Transcript_27920/g.109517  ORF Transcript_27920/g.109517 Transcript_27920/m.109517 type:complete len:94 (+) Transcript_27920:1640-1921(+)